MSELSKPRQMFRASINAVKVRFEPDRLSPEEHMEDGGTTEELHVLSLAPDNVLTIDFKDYYNRREKWYPLARRVARIKSQGKFATGLSIGTVVHFDAGRGNPINTMDSGRKNNYLYHALGRDGAFYQSNSLEEWGWHAGKSEWRVNGKVKSGVSSYCDGVEVCSAGLVKKVSNEFFAPWYAKSQKDYIHKNDVRFVKKAFNVRNDAYYQIFTAAQERALIQYLLWRKVNDPKNYSFDCVVGHDEVAIPLGRKTDPGGALSMYMPELRAKLKEEYSRLSL